MVFSSHQKSLCLPFSSWVTFNFQCGMSVLEELLVLNLKIRIASVFFSKRLDTGIYTGNNNKSQIKYKARFNVFVIYKTNSCKNLWRISIIVFLLCWPEFSPHNTGICIFSCWFTVTKNISSMQRKESPFPEFVGWFKVKFSKSILPK